MFLGYKNSGVKIAAAISVLVGVITFLLSFIAQVRVSNFILWAALSIATVVFSTFVWISAFSDSRQVRRCLKNILASLVIGIFGTIATSVILLAVHFAYDSSIRALIYGFFSAFLSLILTISVCFVRCVSLD